MVIYYERGNRERWLTWDANAIWRLCWQNPHIGEHQPERDKETCAFSILIVILECVCISDWVYVRIGGEVPNTLFVLPFMEQSLGCTTLLLYIVPMLCSPKLRQYQFGQTLWKKWLVLYWPFYPFFSPLTKSYRVVNTQCMASRDFMIIRRTEGGAALQQPSVIYSIRVTTYSKSNPADWGSNEVLCKYTVWKEKTIEKCQMMLPKPSSSSSFETQLRLLPIISRRTHQPPTTK